MKSIDTLLIELGTEELPPKALKGLSDAFTQNVKSELEKAGFQFSQVCPHAAPRRLAVSVLECESEQDDYTVEKKGPAVSAAFDESGKPSRAAEGWAKANGITVKQAERLKTDKGEWLLHRATVKGKRLDTELQNVLNNAIKKLPIPKPMRWGDGDAEFIRPVHTLCVLFGHRVIPVNCFGLEASNIVSGHRFHGRSSFALNHANDYVSALENEYVIANYKDRMSRIEEGLNQAAKELNLRADYNKALLEEISSLVEWPVILSASFEKTFLKVPKEALIYTMKDDQKYVPLLDPEDNLSNRFLFVSNIESKDSQQVIFGNEKVVRPRLADAQFFFETDKKSPLIETAKKLNTILFQKDLGTLSDKTARLVSISKYIASELGYDHEKCERAAKLAKADLMSNMVTEFPSVQGVMGKHYALHDGEDHEVALAIEEQYFPRFSGDVLPSSSTGTVLSLAEKLDTLVGIFGIGKVPKGDKDPFALRRSAIGLLRILIKNELQISLSDLIDKVLSIYGNKIINTKTKEQVIQFLSGRFKPLFSEDGYSVDSIASVLSNGPVDDAYDVSLKVKAIDRFKESEFSPRLASAYKRVNNILNKNSGELIGTLKIDPSLFENEAESELSSKLEVLSQTYLDSVKSKDYLSALNALSSVDEPLATFFDTTMIMAEDANIRLNRLAILKKVKDLISEVADISQLAA